MSIVLINIPAVNTKAKDELMKSRGRSEAIALIGTEIFQLEARVESKTKRKLDKENRTATRMNWIKLSKDKEKMKS